MELEEIDLIEPISLEELEEIEKGMYFFSTGEIEEIGEIEPVSWEELQAQDILEL